MADPFELLAVEPRFDVDVVAAEARHRELSFALHPDRHAQGAALERRRALSRAIEVNEAMRVLKDPVRRAEALLQRLGVTKDDADATSAPDFLMEVLELREELARAQRTRDVPAVRRLVSALQARQSGVEERLRQGFERLSGASAASDQASRPAAAELVARALGELRFFRRLIGEAHAILDDLD